MARLSDVCSLITDGSHNPPAGTTSSDFLMISSKNVEDDKITFDDPRYLSAEEFKRENKRTNITKGDVLITIVGTVGRAAVVESENPFCLQRSVAAVKPNTELILSRYLMYLLQSKREYLEKEAHGVAQKGIYLKQLSELNLGLILDKKEQQRVVDILDKVSDLITLRKQQLAKLDELVKSRFVEMFGDPMLNPMLWPVHELSEYIEFLTSGSRGWAKYFTEDGEYFITIKNVKNCKITLDDVQHIVPPNNAEAKRTKVQAGDLLISITADLGRTGVVTEEVAKHGAYINQHLTCIRLNKSVLHPLYVAYYMESEAGKEQFQSKNQSAVKAGLNFNSIKSLKLMVPPLENQEQFVSYVVQIEQQKLTSQLSLVKLEMVKKSLMQNFFG